MRPPTCAIRLVRALTLALGLLVLSAVLAPPTLAARCHSRCRDRARLCKHRCKSKHPYDRHIRRKCIDRCITIELECRARC